MPVSVFAAVEGPLELEWSAVGYVESQSATVSASSIGRIDQVLVEEGDNVRAGQVLACLTATAERSATEAQQAAAQGATIQIRSALALEREAASAQSARERRAAAELAAARMRAQQARVALARMRKAYDAALQAAQSEYEVAVMTAQDLETGGRPEEIEQAKAEITAAEAALSLADSDLRRAEELFASGAVAQRDVDIARETRARAAAVLRARRKALELLQQGARPQQIQAARARVRSAEARVKAAEADLDSLAAEEQRVREADAAVSAATAAYAEALAGRQRLAAARADVNSATARSRQASALARQALTQLAERLVRAPFDGTVGRRYVDPGDMATPQTPLFSIVDSQKTWIVAEVDEQDLAPVAVDQRVTITAPAYAGREFQGRVTQIGGEAVPQTEVRTGARIVRVRIHLVPRTSVEKRMLKPGMEVHVRGRATIHPRAILIPSDAIVSSGSRQAVWVVHRNHVEKRTIVTGFAAPERTEVLSGVNPGELVVVSGKEGLSQHRAVRILTGRDE